MLGKHDDDTKITSFTDGAAALRSYLKCADIKAAPMLVWAHLARRVQIAKTTTKGLKCRTGREARAKPLIARTLQPLHWRLWHSQVDSAGDTFKHTEKLLRVFEINFSLARTAIPAKRLTTALKNVSDYIESQVSYLVNYGQRQRQGLQIGTAITEGLANNLVNHRMNKR
jgi:hypothetical protein